ncbi:unnamed protein product [Strongylus vulgaris]|uniref:Glycosyl-hydrolase family 116 N-terminal domain-containing protein n=1 Tax=Strongylus vulgaris TaxID=40348 RepID=A0A3P7JU05_STRVU|nr:unnamed protein product [Strongylus vulgaris]
MQISEKMSVNNSSTPRNVAGVETIVDTCFGRLHWEIIKYSVHYIHIKKVGKEQRSVPLGGIGCGSIGTDFRGGFNKFSLIPGIKEQRQGNVKANQVGVPLGGIGCGSIGTDFRGGFNKFSLIPGIKEQRQGNVKANQFILTVHDASDSELVFQSLLTTADFTDSRLSSWVSYIHGYNTRYRGLFPRAWREIRIPEIGLTLICEQMSPVIPHNYEPRAPHSKVTSFPVSNFYWTIINNSETDYDVSLTFTFRNGTGNAKWEREDDCSAKILETASAKGLKLSHKIKSMRTIFAIATEEVGISYILT